MSAILQSYSESEAKMTGMMTAMIERIANAQKQAFDAEVHSVLNATYGAMEAGKHCLHYCKCGMIGEHNPVTWAGDTKCKLPLNMKCNRCAVRPRYFWHRFKWRQG
jgi:hypothetical protein